MKRVIFPFILISILLVLAGVQSFRVSQPGEDKALKLVNQTNQYNLRYPQEKVYLHTDRSSYWLGDTIWFKAYLQNSPVKECDLNVELASMYGVVIARQRCFVQDGLAYGDISLPDTLSSGMFELRAYTSWMRNFDEQYFFRKQLIVWNQRSRKTLSDPRELKKWEVDLQFMPEGGTFVAGLKQKVAFKATDQNGLGVKVEGRVLDASEKEVARFTSLHKGMGSFWFEPKAGEKYQARVIVNDDMLVKTDLPEVQPAGVVLRVDPGNDDSIRVKIFEKSLAGQPSGKKQYLLLGQSKGAVYFSKQVTLHGDSAVLSIGKNKLPTGITQLTLFDSNLLPHCERLVFVDRHDQVSVTVEPDKTEYNKREKVILDIYTLDKEENPLLSNLSVSVFNTDNQLALEKYPENIQTRFLLSSELKGNIESPAYYFKDDSASTVQALDNLLLTQGYRSYTWQAIKNDQFPEIAYQPDRGITIRGTVKTLVSKKPIPNTGVNLLFLKTAIGPKQTVTDSLGRFEFPGYFFKDTVSIVVSAQNPARKTDRQKNQTWVELDKRAYEFPDYKYLFRRDQNLVYQYDDGQKVSISNALSEDDLLKINRKWRLTDTIMLGEVKVMKRKLTPGTGPLRLYEQADYVLDIDEDDDDLEYVFDKLWDKFPKVITRHPMEKDGYKYVYANPEDEEREKATVLLAININNNHYAPILIVDGFIYGNSFSVKEIPKLDEFIANESTTEFLVLPYFPQGLIDKIEVIEDARAYGKFEGGAICVFTKQGLYTKMPSSIGMKSANIIGYSVAHTFYSPKYEVKKPGELRDDFRNTLYWNPSVQTNDEGEAWIEFYNSDQSGEVQVVVEGITKDGKLCRGVCKYDVTY